MYKLKENIIKEDFLCGKTQTYIFKQTGISTNYLSRIISGKSTCKKYIAYAIIKCINYQYELEDYFCLVEGE